MAYLCRPLALIIHLGRPSQGVSHGRATPANGAMAVNGTIGSGTTARCGCLLAG